MTRSEKEQYKWLALGAIGGILAGALLPDQYNPVEIVKTQIGGIV